MNEIINRYKNGLLTEAEATEKLDKLQIRGAFGTENYFYIGYDYKNQRWVTVE